MKSAVGEAVTQILGRLPQGVGLVAVSKFHPAQAVNEAYAAGQRTFGESRVQELIAKQPLCPPDVKWHFIGHLQTNKVRQIIGRTAMIESIDSQRLLDLVDAESAAAGVVTRVLMQVHVAAEETKYGFTPEELLAYFAERRFEKLRATHLCGIMGMATNTDDTDRVRADFQAIASLRARILEMCPDLQGFDTVSMGMSEDWPLAVQCGSNLVRIGSAIFGERNY